MTTEPKPHERLTRYIAMRDESDEKGFDKHEGAEEDPAPPNHRGQVNAGHQHVRRQRLPALERVLPARGQRNQTQRALADLFSFRAWRGRLRVVLVGR